MATEELRKIYPEELKEILEEHRLWLNSGGNEGTRANLESVDFRTLNNISNIDLRDANLKNAIFRRVTFKNTDLSGTNLEKADFRGASLQGCQLNGAQLSGANLQGANLKNAGLTKSYLSKALLQNVNLYQAMLTGANLKEAILIDSDLTQADFRRADLSDAKIRASCLQGANFCEAKMIRAELFGTDLRNAVLTGANLQHANLENANLENANLQQADFTEATLINANLVRVKIKDTIFFKSLLGSISIDAKNIPKLSEFIRNKFGRSFKVYEWTDFEGIGEKHIVRSIEFPPEYHQAGISILNYFGTILKNKYPNQKAKVRIEQDGKKVTMIIDPLDGDKEIIENALDEYGLLITGQMAPEDFTDDRLLALELKNELRMARARVESQREIIEYQRSDMAELRRLIDTALRNPAPIEIQTTATSNLQSNIRVNIEIAPQISLVQGGLNEIKKQLPVGSKEAETVQDLQDSLTEISEYDLPQKVAESSAISKFRRFLENVEKAETTAGKVIKTTKDGIDIARQLAGHYNKIAQWCGLPQVPEPFVRK